MDVVEALEHELQRREYDSDGLVKLLLEAKAEIVIHRKIEAMNLDLFKSCKAEIERLRAELWTNNGKQAEIKWIRKGMEAEIKWLREGMEEIIRQSDILDAREIARESLRKGPTD